MQITIFLLFVDIDECEEETFNCTKFSQCKNLIGAYECRCKAGYRETANGSCQGNTAYSCRILPFEKVLIDMRVKLIEPELEENKYVNMSPDNKLTEKQTSMLSKPYTNAFYRCYTNICSFKPPSWIFNVSPTCFAIG